MHRAALVLCVGLFTACTTPTQAPEFDEADVIAGEVVVGVPLDGTQRQALGLTQLDWEPALGHGLFEMDGSVSIEEMDRILGRSRSVRRISVEPNMRVRARAGDPYRRYQWNLDTLAIETAWSMSTGAGVRVAVLDTGVSFTNADRPVNLIAGWDFIDNDDDPRDENGHGTHVANTIAEATGNGIGCASVAPDAEIVAVRVLGADGSGSSWSTARGIVWAVDNGVDVINLSLGSDWPTSVERDAIEYAEDNGVIVVAATGNEAASKIGYPARYDSVIAVGAVGADDTVPYYSNGGTGIDVVAPGGNFSQDINRDRYGDGILQETLGGYEFQEGTSMATPHVSGLAALLLGAGAVPEDVLDLIVAGAVDLGSPGWDADTGWGRISPVASLKRVEAEPEPEPEPTVDTTAPVLSGIGGTRQGTNLTLWWTTDEASSSEIEFQGYGTYGDADARTTDHRQAFTIDSAATYTFRVISVDDAGNLAESAWYITRP